MSVSTEFLSHPKEQKKLLRTHLLEVARRASDIVSATKFSPEPALYAGLLHDFGKLNPFYQRIFVTEREDRLRLETQLLQEYERQHSIFSAWAAWHLLGAMDHRTRSLAVATIAGHHSKLSNVILTKPDPRRLNSQNAISSLIPQFRSEVRDDKWFGELKWDECKNRFPRPIRFQFKVTARRDAAVQASGEQDVLSFLEASAIFSALLQADRGSFQAWASPVYNIRFDTTKLICPKAILAPLRQEFQQKVLMEYRPNESIAVIEAPTGTGKTKLFLDLIAKHQGLEKVIYFSPLLALTEDFEDKVMASTKDPEEILVYNHLFSGTLSRKKRKGFEPTPESWNFLNESFNAKFIITTTQRLLITLYSNLASDKLKLVSLRNSLLIIDEIQVVPKFLLANFIALLREMCRTMNTRILLVSATIPYEIREAQLPIYGMSKSAYDVYHEKTLKKLDFSGSLCLPENLSGKILLMANTRPKARKLLACVNERRKPVYYLTTGVRKKDRAEILARIKSEECIVVSTQITEAGVDIDFSEVYREAAPLDSIVQVMGRLNREAGNQRPVLHIFCTDGDHRPYSELEYRESLKILQHVRTSRQLYDELAGYYGTVSSLNLTNQHYSQQLFSYQANMDFAEVWRFVRNHVLGPEEKPVLVPDTEKELETIRRELLGLRKFDRNLFRRYGGLLASFPHGRKARHELFDQELLEKRGILLPQSGKLGELYDRDIGLDKWLT